jgi:hypothetical protein
MGCEYWASLVRPRFSLLSLSKKRGHGIQEGGKLKQAVEIEEYKIRTKTIEMTV